MEKILTVNDVANVLQVKPITVREMFREQRIRGFKVGKAWRTTEQMLEEDIATLARGETPPPMPAATAKAPARRNGKSHKESPSPKKNGLQPAARKPRATAPAAPEGAGTEDDTQGLLF